MPAMKYTILFTVLGVVVSAQAGAFETVRQITFTPKNHDLDNNDNFSPDGRYLVYDTRETVGPGIGNGQSIEMVEIATSRETVLYRPNESVTGEAPAPGVGAASFSGAENQVAFIHGPPVAEVPLRGPYGKPNRTGAVVDADPGVEARDGHYPMGWLDKRDIATDRDTLPGAHRGGTHRHEYSLDGQRIGFTYDDFLLPEYARTIGYMVPHRKAPKPASHYFALLVRVAPKGTSKPGEIETAYGDSWVGREGRMRAFIGKVREEEAGRYEESLFVVDIPEAVDITTAEAGSAARFPSPPEGLRVRRLTHEWAGGVVRGTAEGDRIAYYGRTRDGTTQVFVIPADGSDRAKDTAKRPSQLTRFAQGADGNLRWHPSGNTVFCVNDNAVAAICAVPGQDLGKTVYLTPREAAPPPKNLVVSPDGRSLAFNRRAPAYDYRGKRATNYTGEDFLQIFTMDFPDHDGDGVADAPGLR